MGGSAHWATLSGQVGGSAHWTTLSGQVGGSAHWATLSGQVGGSAHWATLSGQVGGSEYCNLHNRVGGSTHRSRRLVSWLPMAALSAQMHAQMQLWEMQKADPATKLGVIFDGASQTVI